MSDTPPRAPGKDQNNPVNTLTLAQKHDASMIVSIIKRQIERTGSFKDVLTDYAHAYARNERFDTQKADTFIRAVFKEEYGQTMNEMLTQQREREQNLPKSAHDDALLRARSVISQIEQDATLPLYRAVDWEATTMSADYSISESAVKRLMNEVFEEVEGHSFYQRGKQAEEARYARQAEPDQPEREEEPEQGHQRSPSR
ncbi:hypothetical protein [Roseibium album]|uniref:Uncharacterized protein n=1 Tax=Roseibium album TaxID=311410 RepID=A0A0M6ZTW4_9HYPH|nr:hypothetical protein [Roseibium album]CTQ58151.1 hypothetical protein LA5094_00908 [Roseibium album]CTQ65692.1 hypothetical protein LA5096_00819 [Roseibium album]CTQ70573.1 hypothetical protein LA5095_01963 [Roseibium album]